MTHLSGCWWERRHICSVQGVNDQHQRFKEHCLRWREVRLGDVPKSCQTVFEIWSLSQQSLQTAMLRYKGRVLVIGQGEDSGSLSHSQDTKAWV